MKKQQKSGSLHSLVPYELLDMLQRLGYDRRCMLDISTLYSTGVPISFYFKSNSAQVRFVKDTAEQAVSTYGVAYMLLFTTSESECDSQSLVQGHTYTCRLYKLLPDTTKMYERSLETTIKCVCSVKFTVARIWDNWIAVETVPSTLHTDSDEMRMLVYKAKHFLPSYQQELSAFADSESVLMVHKLERFIKKYDK